MKIIILLALLAGSCFVNAADVSYDDLRALQDEALQQAEYETRDCMRTSAKMFLMQGVRDQKQIMNNMTALCGIKVRAVVIAYRLPNAQYVDDYLKVLAYFELQHMPGVKITNPKLPPMNQGY